MWAKHIYNSILTSVWFKVFLLKKRVVIETFLQIVCYEELKKLNKKRVLGIRISFYKNWLVGEL